MSRRCGNFRTALQGCSEFVGFLVCPPELVTPQCTPPVKASPGTISNTVFWVHKAADQGYAVAQDALGYVYLEGRGMPKDDQQAAAWFRKAADQGYVPAQNKLGFLYQNGEGVEKDSCRFIKSARRFCCWSYCVSCMRSLPARGLRYSSTSYAVQQYSAGRVLA